MPDSARISSAYVAWSAGPGRRRFVDRVERLGMVVAQSVVADPLPCRERALSMDRSWPTWRAPSAVAAAGEAAAGTNMVSPTPSAAILVNRGEFTR